MNKIKDDVKINSVKEIMHSCLFLSFFFHSCLMTFFKVYYEILRILLNDYSMLILATSS